MTARPKRDASPPPAVTAEVTLLTIDDARLQLLLVRRAASPLAGVWSLPGGRVGARECLEDCALRVLEEETGVTGVYLEQLYTFGKPGRHGRERVISVAYTALAPRGDIALRVGPDVADTRWFDIDALPKLAFDHDEIVAVAVSRLRAKLDYSTIALQFMDESFTLSELQGVYQSILGQPLDKRNFRKQILALESIEPTSRYARNGSHRPARLFRAKHPRRVEIIK
jgi:8-oxo-dGTP diphosphatase